MPAIRANGLDLYYEAHGAGEPVLFVMGLGAQLVLWPEPLWQSLHPRGYRTILFDNRDVGLSERLEHLPVPSTWHTGLRWLARRPLPAPYRLDDMAQDTAALVEELALGPVHLVGASMGGMIGQLLAARRPELLRSLTLIMSSPGSRDLPGARPRASLRLLHRPRGHDREALIRYSMGTMQAIGSPAHPPDPDELYRRTARHIDRSYYPPGYKRQFLASLASPPRDALCRQITTPTLVLHGADDPLIPAAHGRRLAELIPAARYREITGMGHDLPGPLLPDIVSHLEEHFRVATL